MPLLDGVDCFDAAGIVGQPLVKRLAAMALAPCYINCAMSLK